MANKTKDPKIVVVGGGSGSSAVLQGLKKFTTDITAVVTMFDSGGSSGLLHNEFGYPPLGDLRQCLLGLSEDDETTLAVRELLGFRFQQESSLKGHSLGNLLLAALTTIGEDLELAIEKISRLLRIHGQVIPVSLEWADLCAKLMDGEILRGESTIDLRGTSTPYIDRVFLEHPVAANPQAIKAILQADLVILGPGDLYTSVIPNLLADSIPEALTETKATRVYVCNLMTKLGETDDFKASDFVREMNSYLIAGSLDWVLINSREIPEEVQTAYLTEGARPVVFDLTSTQQHVPGVFATFLSNNELPLKHDPERIAEAAMALAGLGRVPEADLNDRNRWHSARSSSG
ncbi:MAG: uridine diphosphate-N-acetylglucosamine-binding protein YvcK [Dehalococcoidia bacterium]